MKRALIVMLAVSAAGCRAPQSSPNQPAERDVTDTSPGLVVLLIIDQFPEWVLERKRAELPRGFGRLLSEGEWRIGRHPSGATFTAPGHALLGTGEPPATSGIICNEWWSRELGKRIKAADDENGKTTSKRLRVPGLGDAIAAAGHGAKAVAVSLKNRAARLPLGHSGLALYYDVNTASFVAHGGAAPWLAAHHRAHPIAPRLVPWQPQDPVRLAKLSGVVDAQRGEVGEKGFGIAFPHDPKATKNPNDAVYAMPLGNDIVLETALSAIDGEQLGADKAIDILVISLSAHDYIAHGWGHESWEAWDSELLLDAALDNFLAELDRKIGKGRWALVLTSDHGGAPLPETIHGGRYTDEQIKAAANQAASLVLGPGEWVADASVPYVYLSPAALAHKERAAALKKIELGLKAFPGLAVVGRTEAFAGRCDERKGDERAICLMLDPERSGELFFLPAHGWIMEEEGERLATAHGSLNDYDRNVPVVILPFDRKPHPPLAVPGPEIPLTDVAPMLKQWLQLPR